MNFRLLYTFEALYVTTSIIMIQNYRFCYRYCLCEKNGGKVLTPPERHTWPMPFLANGKLHHFFHSLGSYRFSSNGRFLLVCLNFLSHKWFSWDAWSPNCFLAHIHECNALCSQICPNLITLGEILINPSLSSFFYQMQHIIFHQTSSL